MKKLLLTVLAVLSASTLWAAAPSFSNPYHIYLRALLLESQGNFIAAQEELSKAIEIAPDSPYLRRTGAELALRLGQVNKALEHIEKANELDPKDSKSLILAGQIHWALGHATEAEQKLKQAVELDPDATQATVSLAGALTQKNPQEALRLYKNFLNRHPGEVEIQERLAQLYQAMGDIDKAQGAWETVLEWAPGSLRGHLALAQIAEVKFDTATAIGHYEQVMSQDPNNLALLLRVGELRYRNNEMAQAFEAFSKAQNLAPTSASANFWLALLAENKGDWNEAIRLFKQVAEQAPDAGVLLRLSYYYSQAGRYSEAVKTLEKLLQLQPKNTDFLSYLAVAYEQNKQPAQAEKTLQKLIEINPADYESRFQLATLYDRRKKFLKAEEELKQVIVIKPDFHVAQNYLGYSYADRGLHLEEAEKMVMSALASDPQNAAYLDSMGWVYYRQGKWDKAVDFLSEASLKSQDVLIWEHYGDALLAGGDWEKALLVWQEALITEPNNKIIQKRIQKTLSERSDQEKIRFYLKKAIIHFSDIKSFEGMVTVTACDKRPCFGSQASISYERRNQMKIEIPGPLAGPLMMFTKKFGFPGKYGAIHPLFQSAEVPVVRACERLESLLSAEQLRELSSDQLEKSVVRKGGGLEGKSDNVRVLFDDKGNLRLLEWNDLEFSESLKIGAYQKTNRPIPSELEWRDKKTQFSIHFELLEPRAVILQEPQSEKK